MSKARSAREVCSTTIGTRGLIVLASFASSAGILPDCSNRPGLAGRAAPASAAGGGWVGTVGGDPIPLGSIGLAAGSPELSGGWAGPGLGSLLAPGPELLACLGLFDRDRLCLGHQQVDGLPRGHFCPHSIEATGRLELLEQLLGGRALALGGGLGRLAGLLVGRLDLLRLDDRRQHRLAPERGGGLGLGLV